MILAGHQPEYLPYIGYFYKIAKCDAFILVDHIQYAKKDFQNRNYIKSSSGPLLLTVPVKTSDKFEQKIYEVMIDERLPWRRKHLGSIINCYQKSPYYKEHIGFFKDLYSRNWTNLLDLNVEIIDYVSEQLHIKKKWLYSSEYNFEKNKDELLIEMCKKLNFDTYLSGQGGKNYVNDRKFEASDLKHIYTDFQHPTYPQQFGEFKPYMSTIDLLFNMGERSKDILIAPHK